MARRLALLVLLPALVAAAGGDDDHKKLMDKLQYFAKSLVTNEEADVAHAKELEKICKDWSTPAVERAKELKAGIQADAKKVKEDEEATENMEKAPQEAAKTIEAENKKVAAIAEAMKYLENVRRIGRERRAEFINVLDVSDKSWQEMTKEFMSGFETDDKKLFLLQVNEGEGHRFKVRRALRNVAQAVGDPEPNIGGEDLIGGVFGYANALTKALEEAKKTAVQHGKSIKALIEDSKTGKERVAEVAKKHVVELEQKKKEGEAAVEQAKSDEAKTKAQEQKLKAQLEADEKEIEKERRPCVLYRKEFDARKKHREKLKAAISDFLGKFSGDKAEKTADEVAGLLKAEGVE